MVLCEPAADVQAKSNAWDFGDYGARAPIETVENLVALVFGDTHAVVLHTKQGSRRVPRQLDEKARRGGCVRQAVVDQVVKYPTQLSFVGLHQHGTAYQPRGDIGV